MEFLKFCAGVIMVGLGIFLMINVAADVVGLFWSFMLVVGGCLTVAYYTVYFDRFKQEAYRIDLSKFKKSGEEVKEDTLRIR